MFAVLFAAALQAAVPPEATPDGSDRPLEAVQLLWEMRPSARDFAEAFPDRAMRQELEGRAVVLCTAGEDRLLNQCNVEFEDPADYEFGEAAVRLARKFKLAPGSAPAGAVIRVKLRFNLPRG